jgi:hypothetical protein
MQAVEMQQENRLFWLITRDAWAKKRLRQAAGGAFTYFEKDEAEVTSLRLIPQPRRFASRSQVALQPRRTASQPAGVLARRSPSEACNPRRCGAARYDHCHRFGRQHWKRCWWQIAAFDPSRRSQSQYPWSEAHSQRVPKSYRRQHYGRHPHAMPRRYCYHQ